MEKVLKSKKILVVDDEPDLREVIALEFQFAGAETAEAGSGNEAIQIIKANSFDVVVSDIRMPNGDGISLLGKIKQLDAERPVVLLVTGFSDVTTDEAYSDGAEALFIKPFDRKEIVRTINRLTLSKAERWATLDSKIVPQKLLTKNLPDFETALKDGSIRLGRGGFFVQGFQVRYNTGELVSFVITFASGSIPKLEGVGTVRWTRQIQKGELPPGYGVEFEFLEPATRETLVKRIDSLKPTCFIPNK